MGWPVFPSAASPTWFVEGLATYFESELTGAGRVKGTWQEMVMRAAALEGEFGTVQQVSGDSPVWPGGHRPYVYGARYIEHMAEVHGEETLGGFARSVAGLWVPFRMNAAARDAFGVSVRQSWEAWGEDMTAAYHAVAGELARTAPVTVGEQVEGAGRLAGQAVVSRDGGMLAFMRSDGVDAAQIRVSDPSGTNARRLTRVNGTGGSLSWGPDGGLFFTQLDFTDRYRLKSDLYRAGRDGRVARITYGERISYADVSPDGRRAVAVQEGDGTNALVIVALSTGEVTPLVPPAQDRHWAFPRWSPDGTRIAVARWEAPAMMDIVVLDEAGDVVAEVTRDRAVDTTPFWAPDGSTLFVVLRPHGHPQPLLLRPVRRRGKRRHRRGPGSAPGSGRSTRAGPGSAPGDQHARGRVASLGRSRRAVDLLLLVPRRRVARRAHPRSRRRSGLRRSRPATGSMRRRRSARRGTRWRRKLRRWRRRRLE